MDPSPVNINAFTLLKQEKAEMNNIKRKERFDSHMIIEELFRFLHKTKILSLQTKNKTDE
jgi:hypothetical protein